MPPPPPPPAAASGLLAAGVRGVLLAAVGLAAVTAAVHAALPWPRAGSLAAKVAVFEQTKDEWDAVLVGSSRVAHGLVPAVLEEELARLGAPLRVFNLAVDAMGPYEADYLLRHVLALQPARLAWAFLELDGREPLQPDHKRFRTARELHWHDLRQTRAVLRTIGLARVDPAYKRTVAWAHVELFLMRLFNVGRGSWWLDELLSAEPRSGEVGTEEIREHQGFIAYDMTPGGFLERGHRAFLKRLDAYREQVVALDALRPSPADLATWDGRALRDQLDALAAAGVAPIHFLGPTSQLFPFVGALQQTGVLPDLLDFARPREHPELYAAERRFDDDHLDLEGARLFSRLFAAEVAPRVLAGESR